MKRLLVLLFALIPVMAFCQLNVKVVNYDDSKESGIDFRYVNANGKVLITEGFGQTVNTGSKDDEPPELENWPVLDIEGTTQRGSRFEDIDLDGWKEYIISTGNLVWVYNAEGELLPGWPAQVSNSDPLQGAPSIGNIDDDPELEIVVHTSYYGIRGGLYAFNHDGTIVSGFPKQWPDGAPQKEPLLVNIDEDPELEIFSNVYNYPTAKVYAHNGDGTPDNNWDGVELDYIPGCGVSAGDINGDGAPEIIACSYWKVYVFTIKADLIPGFPFTFEQDVRGVSYSNPVIADMDQDGFNEIIVATVNEYPQTDAGAVYIIKNDGSVMNGWPQYILRWAYAPCSVVDFDLDGYLDVIVGDQILSPEPDNYLWAWDRNGNSLPGFPVANLCAINAQGVVADINGDQTLEIIVDNNVTGQPYQIFNHDGSPFTGFIINPQGATFFNTPLLLDLNNDGKLNIAAPTSEFNGFTTDLHMYAPNTTFNQDFAPLTELMYDCQNTGIATPPLSVGINAQEISNARVLPNPFYDKITFTLQSPGQYIHSINIYNTSGALITRYLSSSFEKSANITLNTPIPHGIYFYEINTENQVLTGKLIH